MNGPHINTKGKFDHTMTNLEQEYEDTSRELLNKYLDRQTSRLWTEADQQEAELNVSKAEDQEWIDEQRYETEW